MPVKDHPFVVSDIPSFDELRRRRKAAQGQAEEKKRVEEEGERMAEADSPVIPRTPRDQLKIAAELVSKGHRDSQIRASGGKVSSSKASSSSKKSRAARKKAAQAELPAEQVGQQQERDAAKTGGSHLKHQSSIPTLTLAASSDDYGDGDGDDLARQKVPGGKGEGGTSVAPGNISGEKEKQISDEKSIPTDAPSARFKQSKFAVAEIPSFDELRQRPARTGAEPGATVAFEASASSSDSNSGRKRTFSLSGYRTRQRNVLPRWTPTNPQHSREGDELVDAIRRRQSIVSGDIEHVFNAAARCHAIGIESKAVLVLNGIDAQFSLRRSSPSSVDRMAAAAAEDGRSPDTEASRRSQNEEPIASDRIVDVVNHVLDALGFPHRLHWNDERTGLLVHSLRTNRTTRLEQTVLFTSSFQLAEMYIYGPGEDETDYDDDYDDYDEEGVPSSDSSDPKTGAGASRLRPAPLAHLYDQEEQLYTSSSSSSSISSSPRHRSESLSKRNRESPAVAVKEKLDETGQRSESSSSSTTTSKKPVSIRGRSWNMLSRSKSPPAGAIKSARMRGSSLAKTPAVRTRTFSLSKVPIRPVNPTWDRNNPNFTEKAFEWARSHTLKEMIRLYRESKTSKSPRSLEVIQAFRDAPGRPQVVDLLRSIIRTYVEIKYMGMPEYERMMVFIEGSWFTKAMETLWPLSSSNLLYKKVEETAHAVSAIKFINDVWKQSKLSLSSKLSNRLRLKKK